MLLKRIKAYLYYFIAFVFGKVKFKDKFGVVYYLWINTRLRSSILTGCRTDDRGVIYCIQNIAIFLKLQKKRFTCLDVGAFIGVISLHIAKSLGNSCKLFSFEANNINFERLQTNSNENSDIAIFPYAVSNQEGISTLVLTDDPGQHYLTQHNTTQHTIQEVKTVTINNFCQKNGIEIIDLIKIDAEKHDYEVLLGMSNFLKNNKVLFIIFEYDTRCQVLLEKYNYQVLFIVKNQKYLTKNKIGTTFLNAVAVNPEIDIKNVFNKIND